MHPADREILDDFDRTRAVTIDLLSRVPDDLLVKVPTSVEKSIGWEFFHIADTVAGWMEGCMEDGGQGDLTEDLTKPALLSALEETRSRLLEFFSADDGRELNAVYRRSRGGKTYEFTGRNRVVYLTGHEVHHRAKAIVALRQFGFMDIPFLPFAHKVVSEEAAGS